MLFFIELLIIAILIMTLSTLIFDERKNRLRDMRVVKLKGYWEGDERRSVGRFNVNLEVKYFTNGIPIYSKSADISTKGIRLLLDEKIQKNTPLRLEIKLPNQRRMIKATGEVVWSAESEEDKDLSAKRLFNTGIKFSKFRDDNKKTLFDFVRALVERQI